MKRLLPILFLFLFALSCSDDIQDNTPALQAVKDSVLFRSLDSKAFFNDNGSLLIQGSSDTESLNILINSINETEIELGGDNPNTNIASFTDEFGNMFSTASTNADGQVTYQINANNTVSGNFNFSALRNGIQDTITLSRGFMFEIPILTELGNVPNMGTNDSFSARINSLIFNPTMISAVGVDLLTVSGATQEASISVLFPTDIPAGTYDIAPGTDFRAIYSLFDTSTVLEAQSGTLTIVSNDTTANEVSGNFVFEADGFSITNGEFSVSY